MYYDFISKKQLYIYRNIKIIIMTALERQQGKISFKRNIIEVYTAEDIERGKIVESRTHTILTSVCIGLSIGGVFTFYALVFGLI